MAGTNNVEGGARALDLVVIGLAAALFMLPWAFGVGGNWDATWAAKMSAIMLVLGPLIAMGGFRRLGGWWTILFGAGLALTPLVVGFEDAGWATWAHVIVGGLSLAIGATWLAGRRPVAAAGATAG